MRTTKLSSLFMILALVVAGGFVPSAHGQTGPSPWPADVSGWQKPLPGEHPRLLFRAADLPALKQRAATAEGQAIVKRLRFLLDGKNGETLLPPGQPEQSVGRFTLGHAAGYGLLYQLTGEQKYADLGRQCFNRMIQGEPDRDPRYSFANANGELRAGSSWAIAGLGYDLCYNGWSDEDRKRVAAAFLGVKNGQGFNLEKVVRKPKYRPSKNHTGGIMCGAVAAAALAGDPGTEGAKIWDEWLPDAYRNTIGMLTEGFGDHGWYAESQGPSHVSSDTGFQVWLKAARIACGKDFITPRPNAQYIALRWVMEIVPQEGRPQYPLRMAAGPSYGTHEFTRGGDWSHGGQFAQGFGIVEDRFQPAMLWVYQKFVEPAEHTLTAKEAWVSEKGLLSPGEPSYDAIGSPWKAVVTFDAQSGDLVCRDASNGSLLWRRYIGSPQAADLAIVGGQIYLYYDETAKAGEERRGNAERGPLVALDLATGKLVKTYDEALRAGTAPAAATPHHEDEKRLEKYHPVPWFIVRDDVIVQAYGAELRVLDRVTGRRRFVKTLDADHTWFSPALAGPLLLAAETVGVGRRGRHDGATHVRAVTAFDLADGAAKWRNADAHPLRSMSDNKRGAFTARAEFKPLSIADSLVLIHVSSYQFRQGGRIAVLDAASGRELWHRDYQPKDLYDQGSQRAVLRGGEVVILDGLGARRFHARTGEPIGDPLTLPKGHKRQARQNGACTASRATVDWLICNAYLYVGPDGKVADCFGARGACGQGVVPANGLMYVNPTPCDCGDYTRGYEAMSSRLPGQPIDTSDRLVRGPAFEDVKTWRLAVPKTEWPVFLGGVERRSCTVDALPKSLSIRWREQAAQPRRDPLDADRQQSERHLGALSAPVSAAGVVVVAVPETHQVQAREAATGELRWSFHTSGKVDSPPTLVLDAKSSGGPGGLAIFGCEDGFVYAVRLSDGQLAWKFAAAPTDGLAMLHGHLASAMPLPGSVLVLGDTVIVAAGHHTDLGGLHCYSLDAATGAVRAERVIAADQPAVVTNDILVADAAGSVWLGNGTSMLHLSLALENLPIEATKTGAAANRPALAFDRQGSRVRFRTDTGRGGSTHGWSGAMRTSFVSAHRIASDGGVAYALRDPTANDRHPVRADQTPVVTASVGGLDKRQLWTASIGALGSRPSYSSLIKAGDRLYVGGGARDGSAGFVQILDAQTGQLLATHDLPSRVTECGLAAAGPRLFVCCEGGELICLTGSLAVSFQADDYLKAGIVASANAPNPVERAKDPFAGLPAQVIAVDIPLGTISPQHRANRAAPLLICRTHKYPALVTSVVLHDGVGRIVVRRGELRG